METLRLAEILHALPWKMTVVVPLILVVMYMSIACQGGCHPPAEKMSPMCLEQSLPKSSIADVHMGSRYNIGTMSGFVLDCPKMCECRYGPLWGWNALRIANCSSDPSKDLPKVLDHYKDTDSMFLDLWNASLLTFPCQVSVLYRLEYLSIWISPMHNISCDLSTMKKLRLLVIHGTSLMHVPSMLFTALPLLALNLAHNAISSVSVQSLGLGPIDATDLSDNGITTSPEDLLVVSTLRFLRLDNNKLRKIPALSGLSKLSWLELNNNPLDTMRYNLSYLRQLRCLNLSHTNNPLAGETLLPRSLRALWLRSNNVITLADHALPNLQYLDLSYNNINKISSAALERTSLNWLDLSHNRQHSMYLPTSLPLLMCLDQSHNSIESFKIDFIGYRYIRTLILDHNRITQITFVNLSYHQPKFGNIGLSHNLLDSIDSWPLEFIQSSPGVQINLNQNSIATFTNHFGASSGLCNTIVYGKISMKNNKISHFMDVFNGWNLTGSTLGDLQTCLDKVPLDISDNPLVCDCTDYEVYKHMPESKSLVLSCNKPRTLSGKNPFDLPLDSFICRVYKDCPQGCTCVNLPNTKSIQLLCNHYTDIDLPRVVPKLPKGYKYHLNFIHGNLKEISSKYLQKVNMALFSHNAIAVIPKEVLLALVNIQVVHLDNNHLERLSDDITSITLNSSTELMLSNNRWICDCPALAMKEWLIENGQNILDAKSITCHSPKYVSGKQIILLDNRLFCPKVISVAYIVLICAGTLIILAILVAIPIVVRCWQRPCNVPNMTRPVFRPPPRDECENEEKEFDVYVCYDMNYDDEYVEEWLIPGLEDRGYKVRHSMVHDDPCKSEIHNLYTSINKSKRVLVFFSNTFKKNNYRFNEWETAYDIDIHNRKKRLVTILDWKVDVNDLDYCHTQYFEMRGSVIVREDKRFWQFIVRSLAVNRIGDPPVVNDEAYKLPEV